MFQNRKFLIKFLCGLAFFLLITTLLILRYFGYISIEGASKFISDNRRTGIYVLVALYLLSPVLLLPTFYLTLIAGVLFGPFWGVLIDVTGATLGSTIAFLTSRYVASGFVRKKFKNEKIKRILEDKTIMGWQLNAFFRFNPVFPSAFIGYFFGLTSIGVVEFSLSTAIFLTIPSVIVVSFGSTITDFVTKTQYDGLLIKLVIMIISLLIWFWLIKSSKMIKSLNDLLK